MTKETEALLPAIARKYKVSAVGTCYVGYGPTPRRAVHNFRRSVIAHVLAGDTPPRDAERFLPFRIWFRWIRPQLPVLDGERG